MVLVVPYELFLCMKNRIPGRKAVIESRVYKRREDNYKRKTVVLIKGIDLPANRDDVTRKPHHPILLTRERNGLYRNKCLHRHTQNH